MTRDEVVRLYEKEREYEVLLFGNYSNVKSLSFPSFIVFLDLYMNKIKQAYTGKWQREMPEWLESCSEFDGEGSAPVEAYEQLIKLMALAGAALETYAKINVEKWREDPTSDKKKWE